MLFKNPLLEAIAEAYGIGLEKTGYSAALSLDEVSGICRLFFYNFAYDFEGGVEIDQFHSELMKASNASVQCTGSWNLVGFVDALDKQSGIYSDYFIKEAYTHILAMFKYEGDVNDLEQAMAFLTALANGLYPEDVEATQASNILSNAFRRVLTPPPTQTTFPNSPSLEIIYTPIPLTSIF